MDWLPCPVVATLQHITAALYLVAGLAAGAGFTLARPRLARAAVAVLAAGAITHGVSFALLHRVEPTPPLTHLPTALSFMAWIGTLGFLVLAWRTRLAGLVALVAPMSFVGVVAALWGGPAAASRAPLGAGSLPHAHVLFASAGLALLGLAGLAGLLFLVEHRRLKRKQPLAGGAAWPSLEALDRAGAFAVAAGFPLLTLGVLAGALWLRSETGTLYAGRPHETFCLVAWAIYGVLAALRFGAAQPARRCAISAVAGFACLGFAVVGVELLA
jgi:ABC-type transport system involved in cytochrome c biogenesis permease subunit